MAFRAAALTGTAVDLALDAVESAPRPLLVAGLLGTRGIPPTTPDRMAEEYGMHATRLATSGCELILARGFASSGNAGDGALSRLARRAAVVGARDTGIPAWAVLPVNETLFLPDGESVDDAVKAAADCGAQAVLLEADGIEPALAAVARLVGG